MSRQWHYSLYASQEVEFATVGKGVVCFKADFVLRQCADEKHHISANAERFRVFSSYGGKE